MANAFKNADENKRRNVEAYINTFLTEFFSGESPNQRLFQTMKKATAEAKANGFKPELMEGLLEDDE
jgi:hypothetical protein